MGAVRPISLPVYIYTQGLTKFSYVPESHDAVRIKPMAELILMCAVVVVKTDRTRQAFPHFNDQSDP